ncbi:hypothetical protein KCTC52924_00755 [Arenibacter antarcticus]
MQDETTLLKDKTRMSKNLSCATSRRPEKGLCRSDYWSFRRRNYKDKLEINFYTS